MELTLINLFILGLSSWRISSLIVREEGPQDILAKFRHFIGIRYDEYSNPYGTTDIAKALSCVWCTSVWVSALLTIVVAIVPALIWVFVPFAVSALAIIVEELFGSE